jgi:hypothetical protein
MYILREDDVDEVDGIEASRLPRKAHAPTLAPKKARRRVHPLPRQPGNGRESALIRCSPLTRSRILYIYIYELTES